MYPQTEIPRFQNTAWTQPDRMDSLDRLGHEVEGWWAEDAATQREILGFTLPEFARIRNWTMGEQGFQHDLQQEDDVHRNRC
ncbi:hypothetical protein BGZ96_005013 [Linnemannia gamsii]|uniref:Uncharacterized protein n=1 Tax=Linnemannia gamsii TaxID=64522 RepID=A0ABQ7K4T4_9FUNG|nr:hypothetical protein BGZ96_005013 [Linnemannia gamsii]